MVELASHILDSKAAHFNPKQFKDEYENALKALVKRKAAGKPVKAVEREERPSNVVNLMDALKQSLKGAGAKRRGHSTTRRTTAQRRPARKAHRSAARQRKAG
jgi:non-homologous end joining protein Ku